MWWRPKRFTPTEVVTSVGGRTFTTRTEVRVVGLESAGGGDQKAREEAFVAVSTSLGPCPHLRVAHRATEDWRRITHDENAGAVAVGVPSFDDRFLVFCDELAFVRYLTPALTAAPCESTGGLELGGGRITVHRDGIGHDVAATHYLNALLSLLPPELRR
ncbi:hypothetical protein SK803_14590 [Lentzea sp. BCCO 10_0856]|uniref:Uncharacterized protein n=1 Tax=Lentzea miocenica TaxID=3095431 RepID=A0ABU4T035_9PSEU|nr:hypothetical protein [Lentzea sp. BCCO 10_0856]MDX8031450.1 hypothetical protein [Lentzea sp. BCCO 10_0856]